MKAPAPIRRAAGLCAALAAALPAAAQTTPTATDAWQFEVIPYLWAAGIRSDLKLGPFPGDTVNVSSTSVLKALEFGVMGTLEARKGDWGGLLDMQYVKLRASKEVAGGLAGGYDADYEQQIYTVAGFYRVTNSSSVAVAVLAGARYVDAKTQVDVVVPITVGPGRRVDETTGGWNGIVGVRAIVPVGDKWSLLGYVDLGTGSSSTSSWQAIAGASYQYSPVTSFKFGYRALSYKRDDAVLNKVTMGGLYAGAGLRF
ncbi:MAG: hypothetical protein ABWZ88_19915 [Variovorax sp.]